MFVSIGQASTLVGLSVSTLRRWEANNFIKPAFRTGGGHRRYCVETLKSKILGIKTKRKKRIHVAYARVSSHDQRSDLKRQVVVLKKHLEGYTGDTKVIEDLGSGINYKKRGLSELIELICSKRVKTLVLTHRDRLLRFGSPLLFKLCHIFGTKVIILNEQKKQDFNQELVADVIEIMTVFCSKVYGHRSHKNRRKSAA